MTRVLDLLYQDEVWTPKEGEDLNLETMDPSHRSNLIPFLRGNANRLQRAAEFEYLESALACVEDPSDGVWAAQNQMESEFLMPAEDWLEQTPLMQRLVQLEQGRSMVDRKKLAIRNKLYEKATGYKKIREPKK